MEQEPQEESVSVQPYRVQWHPEVKDDLENIHPSLVDSMVEGAEYRLSRAPTHIGKPLRGTANKLWRIRFGKLRIVYTINFKSKEVWVLAVRNRETVYKHPHVLGLLKMAVVLQEELNRREHS